MMSVYINDDVAAPHEVPLNSLRTGQHFELYITTKISEGILLHKGSCSAKVYVYEESRRTIHSEKGDKVVVSHGYDENWALSTPVVPLEKFSDVQQFTSKQGETSMAKNGAGKKEKKVRAPKQLIITRYSIVAAKQDTEKGKKLQDKEVQTHNAVLYRAIMKTDGLTFEEIRDTVDKKAFGSDSKNPDSIMRWHLQDLRKKGFIKSTDAKEEVTTPAA